MEDYDCVCQYGLEYFRTPTGTEIKWCPACGSLGVMGEIPKHPRLLEQAKKEIVKIRGELQEVDELLENEISEHKAHLSKIKSSVGDHE